MVSVGEVINYLALKIGWYIVKYRCSGFSILESKSIDLVAFYLALFFAGFAGSHNLKTIGNFLQCLRYFFVLTHIKKFVVNKNCSFTQHGQ